MGHAFLTIEARSRFPLLKSVPAHLRCKANRRNLFANRRM